MCALNEPSPSLRELADFSGYSLGTVSMALRGDPRVAQDTRELILKVAKERGYEPDPLLAGRMGRTRRREARRREPVKLAHLVAWNRYESYYAFAAFREFRDGASARARDFGYELEDFLLNDSEMGAARLAAILRTRACPGVLIAPVQRPTAERLAAGLGWPDLDFAACSTIGYTLDSSRVSRVVHDHAGAAEMACARLAALGRERVGLVLTEVMHRRVRGRWLAGWVCAQSEVLAAPRPLVLGALDGAREVAEWLAREKPDAVVTCDWGAASAACRMSGLRPGRDIDLVDLQWSAGGEARAGIDQCNSDVGAAAVEIILGQIGRHERGVPSIPKTVLIQGRWTDGPTAGGAGI